MVSMAILLVTALMTVATLATPLAQDKGLAGSFACGSVCNSTALPFEGAACFEVQDDDGSCRAVFVNQKFGTMDVNVHDVDRASSPLVKRLEFDRDGRIQRACDRVSVTCPNRHRGARPNDCKELLRFVSINHGRWVIEKRDFEGQNWLTLVSSGNCLFAVGRPAVQWTEGETRISNTDINGMLQVGLDQCIKDEGRSGGSMEMQGMANCKNWPLTYWITDKNKFSCCRPDNPADLSRPGK